MENALCADELIFTENPVLVNGESLAEIPESLYVPPKALRVILESFDGPLDLLLYLIKKQNIDILDIPIAKIADQYMAYIHAIEELELGIVSDYLVMAAMLAQIKSKMLLPKPANENTEEDPRAELVRRLEEYAKYKKVAERLDDFPRLERDVFSSSVKNDNIQIPKPELSVDISELLVSFTKILKRAALNAKHLISREGFSIRDRMVMILDKIDNNNFMDFKDFFTTEEGKMGVIVTFVAILELIKQNLIFITQTDSYQNIYIKRK